MGRVGRPDEFYGRIADLYRWHGMVGAGTFIAGLFDVPVTTATGWIKTARGRGLLEPMAARSCYECGRPHTKKSLAYSRSRKAGWTRPA